MSVTDERAKQTFSELECVVYNLHSKPLPRKLYQRARREYTIVERLQQFLLKRPDIIVRPIDKGKGFYIGNTATIEYKTQEYMDKTEAYKEITIGHCPLADNLRAVQNVLDYLVKQKVITKAQRDKLLPNSNKLELAHLYTLPKVHKVRSFSLHCILYKKFIFLFSLEYHYDPYLLE
jgi:hypothetical protein